MPNTHAIPPRLHRPLPPTTTHGPNAAVYRRHTSLTASSSHEWLELRLKAWLPARSATDAHPPTAIADTLANPRPTTPVDPDPGIHILDNTKFPRTTVTAHHMTSLHYHLIQRPDYGHHGRNAISSTSVHPHGSMAEQLQSRCCHRPRDKKRIHRLRRMPNARYSWRRRGGPPCKEGPRRRNLHPLHRQQVHPHHHVARTQRLLLCRSPCTTHSSQQHNKNPLGGNNYGNTCLSPSTPTPTPTASSTPSNDTRTPTTT